MISEYQCKIKYHPSKANIVADVISRKAQARLEDEVEEIESLFYGMRILLLENSQQEEVFTPMHEVEILDYEELKFHQKRPKVVGYWEKALEV